MRKSDCCCCRVWPRMFQYIFWLVRMLHCLYAKKIEICILWWVCFLLTKQVPDEKETNDTNHATKSGTPSKERKIKVSYDMFYGIQFFIAQLIFFFLWWFFTVFTLWVHLCVCVLFNLITQKTRLHWHLWIAFLLQSDQIRFSVYLYQLDR